MTSEYAHCTEPRMQSQNHFIIIFLTLLAILMLSSGCKKPDVITPPRATPTPVPLSETSVIPIPRHSEAITPSPRVAAPSTAPEPVRDPGAIARAFRAASDPEERGALAAELWEVNTPDAIATLQQLHAGERDENVRADLLSGLGDDPTPETREARYRFLLAALAPAQPKDVRELAIELLGEFEDVRAVATLQTLVADGDPDIRETAAQLLAARQR